VAVLPVIRAQPQWNVDHRTWGVLLLTRRRDKRRAGQVWRPGSRCVFVPALSQLCFVVGSCSGLMMVKVLLVVVRVLLVMPRLLLLLSVVVVVVVVEVM
jgi:hypothetical protein